MPDDTREGGLPDEIGFAQSQSGRQIFETLERSRKAGFDAMGAALAHELNQPLAALTIYLQALTKRLQREPPADPILLELSNKASREAERAGDIVRRMRRLSLRAEPELQAIDLNALARECAEATRSAAAQRAVVKQDFDPSLPPVLADPVQIRQVILNLLRNAAEATSRVPRPLIEMTTRARQESVRLVVSDNGPGVKPSMAAKLFRAFETNKSDGMGLGLAISRMIAQNHGGDLVLEPQEGGQGARFELRLPVQPINPKR